MKSQYFAISTLVLVSLTLPLRLSGRVKGRTAAPVIEARYVEAGPTVDGDPSDPVWRQAAPESIFSVLGRPETTSSLTTVRALYDNTSLYLLYQCRGKQTRDLQASTIQRDGPLWKSDDEVEFFFFPGDQDSLYIQFITNPIGAKYDTPIKSFNGPRNFKWLSQPGWAEDSWSIEMEIPMRQFVDKVEKDETWRVNFTRYLRVQPDSTIHLSWSPTIKNFYEPEHFGLMRFGKTTEFNESPQEVDWTADESRAIANLKRLKGGVIYGPMKSYFDNVLGVINRNRPLPGILERLSNFIREYPDSASSLSLALRAIYPAASTYRASPETVESFIKEAYQPLSHLKDARDLFRLSQGLFYSEIGRKADWIGIYHELSTKGPSISATAAYFLLTHTHLDPTNTPQDKDLIDDAMTLFTDLVVKKSTPLYLEKKVAWVATSTSRDGIGSRLFSALKIPSGVAPRSVLGLIHSLRRSGGLSEEFSTALAKTEFELRANKRGPLYSAEKADSLIIAIAPRDEEYAQVQLRSLLRARIHDLEPLYATMGPGSLPDPVKKAIALRRHLKGGHPIDMIFSLTYEAVDSLDQAVKYMEQYNETLGKRMQRSGPAARYLKALRFKRDHRNDPDYFSVPRDAFRLLYRVQGFKGTPDLIEVSDKGQAVIYPNLPDSLDPRARIGTTVPALVDSPAVSLQLSEGEVDSLYSLCSRYNFLKYRARYDEPCAECGVTDITLMTPSNVQTVHFVGDNKTRAPFRLKRAVASILDKYLSPLYYLRHDRRALTRYYGLWTSYNSPGTTPDKRLDLLLELFDTEPMWDSWHNTSWYIDPLINLGEETGRGAEVSAELGLRYFDSIFKWKDYARERLLRPNSKDVRVARGYLKKAADGFQDEGDKAWYEFLADFTQSYSGDLTDLTKTAGHLRDEEHRMLAQSLILWLACAKGDLQGAGNIYADLLKGRGGKEIKFQATLRMMLCTMDHDQPKEAMKYLSRIEDRYRDLLPNWRKEPILKLEEYSKVDLAIDKAHLLLQLGNPEDARSILMSMEASEVPPDRKLDYGDLMLSSRQEIPSKWDNKDIRDYFRTLFALVHTRQYEAAERWGGWILDHFDNPRLSHQAISMLARSFSKRDAWDDLQRETAKRLLDNYRKGSSWKGTDPTIEILNEVIGQGDAKDVASFWKEEILPYPLTSSMLLPLDNLVGYFTRVNDYGEALEVLDEILNGLPSTNGNPSLRDLILTRYTIKRADLLFNNLDRQDVATALIDSLSSELPKLSKEAYPYAFMAVAGWKARQIGWNALGKFVRPFGDSLVSAEKEMNPSIYHPPFMPDMPFPSPLLALKCIADRSIPPAFRTSNDFLGLLGIDPAEADETLKALGNSPYRLKIDCGQAVLGNWEDKSFGAILKRYSGRPGGRSFLDVKGHQETVKTDGGGH